MDNSESRREFYVIVSQMKREQLENTCMGLFDLNIQKTEMIKNICAGKYKKGEKDGR